MAIGRVYRRGRPDVPAGRGGAGIVVSDDALVEVLGVEPIDPGRRQDDDLMPSIARVCERAGVKPSELERVAVSAGPGGFTGLRLAVVTAKFIAEGTGAACISVPTAEVVARRCGVKGRFGVALACKGASAFVTTFDGRVMAEPGRPMDASSLDELKITALVADRFLPAEFSAWAKSRGVPIVEPSFDPVACLEASASAAIVDTVALAPIYAREPEAVTKWRQLHPR